MKKLLKHIVYAASLLMFATQASAWVSKGFVPAKVDIFTVDIDDQANDGCWTNIGEVKRYAEDKLELSGHKVLKEKFDVYKDDRHYVLDIIIIASRLEATCFGSYNLDISKQFYDKKIAGIFSVGQKHGTFSGYENVNKYILNKVGKFMKEVEDPQWPK